MKEYIKPTIDFPNWKKLSMETVNFYFSETEKRLEESIASFQNIKNKSFDILKIILPILTISIGFIFFEENNWDKLIPVIAFLFCQIIAALCLFSVILPRNIKTKGSLPTKIIVPDNLNYEDDKLQFIGLVLNYCENLEPKILSNMNQNRRCGNLLTAALFFSCIIAPSLFLLILFC